MNLLEYLINTSIANGGKVELTVLSGTITPEEDSVTLRLPAPYQGALLAVVVADDDDQASETVAQGANTIYDYNVTLYEPYPDRVPNARAVYSYVKSDGTALTRNISNPVEIDGKIVLGVNNRNWSPNLTYRWTVLYGKDL